jgi:hypothetical protein
LTAKPNASLPVKDFRICAAAAEKTLCPEKYSGKGGARKGGSW